MLTRRHIRVKVLQTLYARHQSQDQDQESQEKFLTQSLEQMQELQALLLLLIVAVKDQAQKFTQRSQQKYFASDWGTLWYFRLDLIVICVKFK